MKRNSTDRRRRRGFTLTEVMVSMMIFTIGIIGVYGLVASLLRMNRLTSEVRVATSLAELTAEEMLYADYSSLASGSSVTGDYIVVNNVYTATVAGAKIAAIEVAWTNSAGRRQNVELRTVYND